MRLDVVLGGLRADEQPFRDLSVREPFAEQPQHLDLPPAEEPSRPRPGAALRAERAHEARPPHRHREAPERLELGARVPCGVDRTSGDATASERASSSRVLRGLEPKRRAPRSGYRLAAGARGASRVPRRARSDRERATASASTRSRPPRSAIASSADAAARRARRAGPRAVAPRRAARAAARRAGSSSPSSSSRRVEQGSRRCPARRARGAARHARLDGLRLGLEPARGAARPRRSGPGARGSPPAGRTEGRSASAGPPRSARAPPARAPPRRRRSVPFAA